MTIGQSLRKNAQFLLVGFGSAVAALGLMRLSDGAPCSSRNPSTAL